MYDLLMFNIYNYDTFYSSIFYIFSYAFIEYFTTYNDYKKLI